MSSNTRPIKGVKIVEVDVEAEMVAFDSFGPKVKHILRNGPLQIGANDLLENVRRAQEQKKFPDVDLRESSIDAYLAQQVMAQCFALICKDRDEASARAGMIMLKPRKRRR